MLSPLRLLVGAGAASGFCGVLLAKPDNALDRLDPVPSTVPVPVIDFFRPALFSNFSLLRLRRSRSRKAVVSFLVFL